MSEIIYETIHEYGDKIVDSRTGVHSYPTIKGNHYRFVCQYMTLAGDVSYIVCCRNGSVENPRNQVATKHRIGAPAYIDLHSKSVGFYVSGIRYLQTFKYCKACKMSDEDSFIWVLKYGDILPETIEEFYGFDCNNLTIDDF